MLHDVATNPKLTLEVRAVPFMSQIARWPVELFCQRMSALPSPLKSLEPTMFIDVATVPKLTVDVCVVLFLSQIAHEVFGIFCSCMFVLSYPCIFCDSASLV